MAGVDVFICQTTQYENISIAVNSLVVFSSLRYAVILICVCFSFCIVSLIAFQLLLAFFQMPSNVYVALKSYTQAESMPLCVL